MKINLPTAIKNKLDLLFFGAHPDDVELNCGGTLLKLIHDGKKAGIIDLTKGELSTRGDTASRKKETKAASDLIGLTVRENLNIADGNIEVNKINKTKVITSIRKYKPEIIFAPFCFDRHPDHVNSSNLIRESVFYSGLEKIVTGSFKAYKPKKVFYYRNAYDMPVSFIFDISSTFQMKKQVLNCYKTQFFNPGSNEPETFISSKLFDKEIESRARHFGFKIGVEFGEPFFSYEQIKVDTNILFEI